MEDLPTYCPETFLPIITRPEWNDLAAGPNYRVSFCCYGRHLIVTRPCGDSRLADLETLFAHRDRVLDAVQDGRRLPYVEIRDYGEIHGHPNRKARLSQGRLMLASKERCLAWLAVNTPPMIRQVFRIGLLITPAPFPMAFVHDMKRAISQAIDYLEAAGIDTSSECLAAIENITPLHDATHQGFHTTARLLNPHCIHWSHRGTLTESGFDENHQGYRQALALALEAGLQADDYVKLTDFNETHGSWRIRSRSARAMKQAHQALNASPRRSILIGANEALRVSAKLFSPFLSYRVDTVADLGEALRLLRQEHCDEDPPSSTMIPGKIHGKHVQDVLSTIASLTMKDYDAEFKDAPDGHPLADIFAALHLLHLDIKAMVNESESSHAIIEAQNKRLREEISRRAATEEELRQATATAEAANLAKGRFLANMSHEIRTPLSGILGTAELLQASELNQEQAEYCHIIQQSGRGLHGIIDDILDFSKIDSGKMELILRPLSLRRILEEVRGLFAHEAAQEGLSIDITMAEDLPLTVIGDGQRLRQVLINLVGNAIKFTSQGSITISATVEDASGQACLIRLTVADTGIGIPSERLDSVFHAFSQVDDSRRRAFGGTGLGLAICKQLVELMGGSIAAESEHGHGSCFICRLPMEVSTDEREPTPTPITVGDRKGDTLPLFSHYSVLLVEDNHINQRVMVKILEQSGLQVRSADDGIAALDALREQTVDLVVMDVQMPRLDGLECTRRIRTDLALDALPIIGLTASASTEDRQACLEAGMNAYCSKPVRSADLLDLIAGFITARRQDP